MNQALLFLFAIAVPLLTQAEPKILGHAFVRDDGSLWIKDQVVDANASRTSAHCAAALGPYWHWISK